jgi:hypothetical protein
LKHGGLRGGESLNIYLCDLVLQQARYSMGGRHVTMTLSASKQIETDCSRAGRSIGRLD